MDGFCLQGELDLTLFYMIEGYFDNLKSLMTGNDRNLWGLKMKMTLNDFDPFICFYSIFYLWVQNYG